MNADTVLSKFLYAY